MVTDEEILDGINLLAETEGHLHRAGRRHHARRRRSKLIEQGRIPRNESIVVCITGNGYKTAEVVADGVARPVPIGRAFKDFEASYASQAPPPRRP